MIIKYWHVILAFVSLVSIASVSQYRINAVAEEVEKQRLSDQSTDVVVARIEERQENIRDDVEEIKEQIKDQNRKLDKIIEKLNEKN